MKLLVVLFSSILFAACSASDQINDITLPKLVEQYPLPPVPEEMAGPQAQIDFELLVGKDGSVLEAKLIKGSSDTAWNAAALASMRKWKYTPAYYKDQPLKIWLHQTAIVRFVESHCVCLAEISCGTQTEADSAYALLTSGAQFEDVVQKFSLSESKKEGGKLGNVNILKFPKHIQLQIMNLEPEQYTKPIAYDNHYVIFKKLKP